MKESINITDAVRVLDDAITDRRVGLPDDIFYFISRTTPMVNVDLLIRDDSGRTLLSWRNDEYCAKGWHIPGGIVRYMETFEQRIQKTAEKELGVSVSFDPTPLSIEEIILPELRNRGHFISFLYKCSVPTSYTLNNLGKKPETPGYLAWHDKCPDNLINVHERYRKFILPKTERVRHEL